MIESVIINKVIGGIEYRVEIPFGYIPVYDGPLQIGDKAYKIYDDDWQEINFDQCRYGEVRDYYLVIRPTQQ